MKIWLLVLVLATPLSPVWAISVDSGSLRQIIIQYPSRFGEPIFFPTLSLDGKSFLSWNALYGAIVEFDFNQLEKPQNEFKSSLPFKIAIQGISWSPNRRAALLYTFNKENSQTILQYFDLENERVVPLDENILSAFWLNNGQIVSHYLSIDYQTETEVNQILLSNADGSDSKKILDLPFMFRAFADFDPLTNELLLTSQSRTFPSKSREEENLYSLNIQTGQLTKIREGVADAKLTGQKGIILLEEIIPSEGLFPGAGGSMAGQLKLVIYDRSRGEIKDPGLETFLSMAVLTGDNQLIVATPENDVNVQLWRVDLSSGKKMLLLSVKDIFNPNAEYGFWPATIEYLMLTLDDKVLYFVSNDILYGVDLE